MTKHCVSSWAIARARKDTWLRKVSSRVANSVRGRLLRDGTPDTGCGIKLLHRATFLELPRFNHMHRFLPALFQRAGAKVISVPVRHRPRTRGTSKYGLHQSPVGRHRRPVRRPLADRSQPAACDGERALRENPLSASALRFLLHFLCDTIARLPCQQRPADGRREDGDEEQHPRNVGFDLASLTRARSPGECRVNRTHPADPER